MSKHAAQTQRPTPEYWLRSISSADWPLLAELQSSPGYRRGTLRPLFQSPDLVKKKLEATDWGSVCWIAAVAKDPAGVERFLGDAYLGRMSGRRSHCGHIGMGVHDAVVGRGIGTALVAALIESADVWMGLTRLELTVYTDNEPALRLYRRFGFELEGTHRAYGLRDGVLTDAHCMARLRPPPAPIAAG